MQSLLLSTIKIDLQNRISASQPKVDTESAKPLHIFDIAMYEKELLAELESTKAVPLLSKGQSAFYPNPSVNGLRDETTSPTNNNLVSEEEEVDEEESNV